MDSFKLFTESKSSLYNWIDQLRTSRQDPALFLVFADYLEDNYGILGRHVGIVIRNSINIAKEKSVQESDPDYEIKDENEFDNVVRKTAKLLESSGVPVNLYTKSIIINGMESPYDPVKMVIRRRAINRKPNSPAYSDLALTDTDNVNLQLAGILLTALAFADRRVPIIPRGVDAKNEFEELRKNMLRAYNDFTYYPDDENVRHNLLVNIDMVRRVVTKINANKHYYYNAVDRIGSLETLFIYVIRTLEEQQQLDQERISNVGPDEPNQQPDLWFGAALNVANDIRLS